jgi:hypothetical protein
MVYRHLRSLNCSVMNANAVRGVAAALCDIVYLFDAFEFSRVGRECSLPSSAASVSSSISSAISTGKSSTSSSYTIPGGLSVATVEAVLLAGVALVVGVILIIRRRRKRRQPVATATATATEEDDEESLL